ncbi:L-fuculokinase [Volucribacter amazonae]|uniref:L-fuculokinase n=1 Tax=Volucribacter amazonae TaxID=256731 RepID=A0A9X4SHG1_9PAST|nr:L-fuculokinase [Volucribacter amazonae]MDG6894435.1 L-fuculokinase [Volucribacter amazonae]
MPISLILDCGATNVRAVAIDHQGKLLASYHYANQVNSQGNNGYLVWDFETIYQKLIAAAQHTISQLTPEFIEDIVAIGVTTFGVDGAPFDNKGNQLYPIISWQCPRTLEVMNALYQQFDMSQLYQANGIAKQSFNTLFKLRWLQQNERDIYQKMAKFVFISSMINQRLTGRFTTDRTMAGTSMMTNLVGDDLWHSDVFALLNIDEGHFAEVVNAGEIIGLLDKDIVSQIGLIKPIPVVSCGHDTQFAILGSGAGLNQPVLSSGTWEILMTRVKKVQDLSSYQNQGLTVELDAQQGLLNPAMQWLGSAVLEWVGRTFFADVYQQSNYYTTMINEAEQARESTNPTKFVGKFDISEPTSQLTGLSIHTRRGQIYLAALSFMAEQLRVNLQCLQELANFTPTKLICVGGGSKNRLWNQLRANAIQLPIDIVDVSETTALGAAMNVFYGIGIYQSIEQAQQLMQASYQRIYPN